jgi:hypothetical protein
MTKNQALALFDGNASKLGRALGITPQAVQLWRDKIPKAHAASLRDMTPRLRLLKKRIAAAYAAFESSGTNAGTTRSSSP